MMSPACVLCFDRRSGPGGYWCLWKTKMEMKTKTKKGFWYPGLVLQDAANSVRKRKGPFDLGKFLSGL